MGFLFTGIFWGVVLVLLGLSVILKAVFNIHLPIFRLVLALILIWFGVKLLVGNNYSMNCRGWHSGKGAMFCESSWSQKEGSDFSTVFGKGTVDATNGTTPIKVSTVFGSTNLLVSKTVPVEVRSEVVFGALSLPDGSIIPFGDNSWRNDAAKVAGAVPRIVNVSVVFGECRVVEK